MTHPWRVEMFGGLRARAASSPDQPVTRFRTQKTAALLAYLALKPGPQPREVLCGLLWPDSEPEAARNSLSASLSSLRRQFGDDQESSPLLADRSSVGLDPRKFTSDVAEFSLAQKVAEGAPDDAARIEALSQAVEVYSGPLLPGFYDEWALTEARCREEEFIAALSDLLDLLEDASSWERAATIARRGLGLHSSLEHWHLSLMRSHLALRRPGSALRQFEEMKQALEREGSAPSARALKLAQQANQCTHEQFNELPATEEEAVPVQVLASAPTAREGRLPAPLTRFFGRRLEITQIHRLLLEEGERLITLSGPGGSGKTRLCLEAARTLPESDVCLRGAIAFVPLADISDAAFVFSAIRDALRLPAVPNVAHLDQVAEALSGAPALLLLDNFEQLVEEGAPLVQELLERLPQLSILATSRQVLGLPGEREYPVAPLPVPREDASPERLKECSGTALFIDRAQAARMDFRVDERNARAVAAICRRLDGIPLALELAAARALVLSPAQMLEKLKNSLDLLSTRQRGVPKRHRTLRAAIEWSYGLLSGELQRFFARLSVFRGGWSFEAAEEVCEEPEALDFLTRLRECSLIVTEERAGETRFRMLETLREYALEQLEPGEHGEGEARYCRYFVELAEACEPHLRGPEQTDYLERLEGEQDNFRAVLAWALEHSPDAALRLSAALAPFWETRGHYAEGRGWIEQALAKTSSPSPLHPSTQAVRTGALSTEAVSTSPAPSAGAERHRARALGGAGRFAWFNGDMATAGAQLEESLSLLRESGDAEGALGALSSLIMVRAWHGDEASAVALVREGMELREGYAQRAALLPVLSAFGWAIVFVASPQVVRQGREVNEEVLRLARAAGDKRSEGIALACLGGCLHWQERFAEACVPYRASLPLLQEVGDTWMAGLALWGLGRAELQRGNREEARRCSRELLRFHLGHKSPIGQPFVLDSLAMIAFGDGHLGRSTRLFGAAQGVREALGTMAMPLMLAHNRSYIQALSETLGHDAFRSLWDEGHQMGSDKACAYALEEAQETPQVLADVHSDGVALSKARALCSAGRLAWFEGSYAAARAPLEEGLDILRAASDAVGALSAMSSLIMVRTWQGDSRGAAALVREGRTILERLSQTQSDGTRGDSSPLLPVLCAFGWAAFFVASPETQEDSRAVNQEVALLARRASDGRSEGIAQACLGGYFLWQGDLEEARFRYKMSLPLLRSVGDPMMVPHALWGLARVEIHSGRLDEARRLMVETLHEHLKTSSPVGLPYALEACAAIAAPSDPACSTRLFASANAQRQKQRAVAQPLTVAENQGYLDSLLLGMGEDSFNTAWQEGSALTTEQAYVLALETIRQCPSFTPPDSHSPEPISLPLQGDTPNEEPEAGALAGVVLREGVSWLRIDLEAGL
jgi:predicted ATPase/DNA-binding SARP family transcriptional activator